MKYVSCKTLTPYQARSNNKVYEQSGVGGGWGPECFRYSYIREGLGKGGGYVLCKEQRRSGECNLFISHGRERERASDALN
jgi:hypothetical protein